MNFELISEYQPTGDQPEAIAQLTEGVLEGVPARLSTERPMDCSCIDVIRRSDVRVFSPESASKKTESEEGLKNLTVLLQFSKSSVKCTSLREINVSKMKSVPV